VTEKITISKQFKEKVIRPILKVTVVSFMALMFETPGVLVSGHDGPGKTLRSNTSR